MRKRRDIYLSLDIEANDDVIGQGMMGTVMIREHRHLSPAKTANEDRLLEKA